MLEKLTHQNFDNKRSLSIVQALSSVFKKRRTTRHFRKEHIDPLIVQKAIEVAGTAPSGANKQPWSFEIIEDFLTKRKIREWSEQEEREFYQKTAPDRWLNDLKPLHTNEEKAFLTEASFLIPIFSESYELGKEGEKSPNYYVKESVGLATGLLIAALHLSGLSLLTYTPTNRKFLTTLLDRPKNESTFMVLAVGLPAEDAMVPSISKKTLEEILTTYRKN